MQDRELPRSGTTGVVEDATSRGSIAYVVLLTLVAALGGLLFGYDTAVISGAIGFLQMRFQLGDVMMGWAASCVLVGCIIGASVAGTASDRWGRKKVLLLAAVLFAASAIGAAIPRNLTELVIARILGGIGVGMASMMSPLYIAEVAPARVRGRLISVNQLAIISGILLSYFVNSLVASQDQAWNASTAWRWMFGWSGLPAVLFLLMLLLVPESPRWLAKQGRSAEALHILTRVGGRRHAERELAEIQEAIAHEAGSIWQLLQPGMRLPLVIGVVLAVLQQVTGINTVLYYAPEIFKSAGLTATDAINDTVTVGIVNGLFTLVAIWVVDRLGRKPLLLVGSAGMGVSLYLLSKALGHGTIDPAQARWVLVWILLYVACFAVALGPVVWVVVAEIFPTRIRGRAMSVAVVSLWIACYTVSQFFPAMLNRLGGQAFTVYAIMCAVCFLFVIAFVPETKGKTLEQIEQGWHKKSAG